MMLPAVGNDRGGGSDREGQVAHMSSSWHWARLAILVVVAGCGGGSDSTSSPPPPPGANTPPQPVINDPPAGLTFRAGDTLTLALSATDAQDGALPADLLEWWIDLHHDDHTHPLLLPANSASGSVTLPTRGETSDNIFYRIHLRATDNAGASTEVTRDLLPRKARVTLTTQPAGLVLTLDGQPATAPTSFVGVVGTERDLGADAEQIANGRRWRFAAWSDGGARSHTIDTPSADATLVATFNDEGPAANQPPGITLSAPSSTTTNTAITLQATASDSDGSVTSVQFFRGSTSLGTDTQAPYALSWQSPSAGSFSFSARATDNSGNVSTSNTRTVTVSVPPAGDAQAPSVNLTSPTALADGLSGTLTISATATDNVGVAGVEFQVDGIAIGAEDTSAPYQASLNTAAHTSGQHVIRARARDAAGNRSGWSQAIVRFGGNVSTPQGFGRNDDWISGLANATAFAQTPDGRLLVAEQSGALRVVKNGGLLGTPFVQLGVDSNGERGLIGVAVHPDFASNPFVYVYYTTAAGGVHNRISRFVANGDVAGSSEQILVDLPGLSSATNHNGGAMRFGVDGRLYVGVGDNTSTSKPQNPADPFGKMLRFTDDGSIPSDNPFCTTLGNLSCAVWALGLRNPFTFAVQPGTGRIHINDVGQDSWEEINLGTSGANFGWPGSEGPTSTAGVSAPLFAYRHSAASPAGSGPGGFFTGAAITGGAFYPASGPFPAPYRGNYFFADYVNGFIGRLDLGNGNAAYAFARGLDLPVDMLVGTDGALYVLERYGIARFSVP